ncbi:MFS transporter [Kineococcus gypseus]|uniref:MFS transporter n=1 Tax=Kineococcus gypseus TaxID=1637102 RepID=UPI003D7D9110
MSTAPAARDASAPAAAPAAGRLRAILVLLCTSLGLVIAANSSLAVALPSVGADLRADQGALTWAVDAYSLLFAALLLPAGIAADRFGQRALLVGGLLVFGGASLASAFAGSAEVLIALRAVAGAGAAAVFPVTLAALVSAYPPERRGFAVAVWSGVSAGGAVVGLLAAGALLELFWWGSVQVLFGVGALLLVPGALVLVGQHRDRRLSLDLPGALLAVVALTGLVYGVLEAPLHGWTSGRVLVPIAVGALAGVGFVLRELRTDSPALDVRAFRSRGLAVGSLLVSAQFFTAFGLFTLLPQYLQVVPGYSPLQAALVLLAMSVGAGIGSATMGARGAAWGWRGPAATGLLLMAAGFAGLSLAAGDGRLWSVLAALVLFGAGFGASMVPGTSLILDGLPPERRSVASAVNDITREVGGVLGIAVLSSVLVSTYREDLAPALVLLPEPLADLALDGAGPAQAAAGQLGPAGADLRAAVGDAFASGLADAFAVAACFLVVAGLVCGALAPSRRRPGRHVRRRQVPAPRTPARGTA